MCGLFSPVNPAASSSRGLYVVCDNESRVMGLLKYDLFLTLSNCFFCLPKPNQTVTV